MTATNTATNKIPNDHQPQDSNFPHKSAERFNVRSKSKTQSGVLHRRHPWLPHQAPESLVQSLIRHRPIRFLHRPHHFPRDYCDRGPDTRKVIDFLISLPTRYPNQKHVFLSGNHDLAFAAFVGVLPPPPDGSEFSEGWKKYADSEEREGWFKGDGYERMHLQARRWGGKIKAKFNAAKGTEYKGSIYDAGPTFESYGVPHGSADLVKAVPDKHKKFLADMVWVHEEDNVCVETADGIKHCRLIAVHAGLEKDKDVKQQLAFLKARDTRVPKIEALSGRKNVWDIPKELTEKPTVVVSGHHAKLNIEGLRLIIDEGGGMAERPVAAVVLPSMKIVLDTGALTN